MGAEASDKRSVRRLGEGVVFFNGARSRRRRDLRHARLALGRQVSCARRGRLALADHGGTSAESRAAIAVFFVCAASCAPRWQVLPARQRPRPALRRPTASAVSLRWHPAHPLRACRGVSHARMALNRRFCGDLRSGVLARRPARKDCRQNVPRRRR
jgi:hypothetical protein